MSGFNWDDHPILNESGKGRPFSWDDHPVTKPADPSWLDTSLPMGTTPRGMIQGTLDALPVAGMVAGGVAGSPLDVFTGPVGTVVGAGVGAAGGTALKKAGERFLLGKNESNKDVLLGTAAAVPEGMAGEMGGQIVGKGLSAAAKTKAGQSVIKNTGSAAAKLGELFTGVPKSEIETFAKNAPAIEKLSKENDHNIQEITDKIREKINETIGGHRKGLNDKISIALENGRGPKEVDITPVVEVLEQHKARLDSSLHPEDIKDIDELIKRVKGKAPLESGTKAYQANTEMNIADLAEGKGKYHYGPTGTDGRPLGGETESVINDAADKIIELPSGGKSKYLTNAQGLHTIQKWLQEKAGSAYGQTATGFQVGDSAARAAKAAAGAGREVLSEVSPEIAAANAKLAKLHDIEDVMNKNMLVEGKTASPLMAAGAGNNPANAKVLRQLGEETGTDILGEAQKLSAARTFGKPQLMPVDSTGKAVGRMGLASGVGFVLGGPVGAVTAAGATSPAALKVAIKAGRAAAAPAGQALASLATRVGIKGGINSIDTKSVGSREQSPENALTQSPPQKGEKKWINDGAKKLIDHSVSPEDKELIRKLKDSAANDQRAKDLLIQASDLTPGSKAMSSVMAKIKAKIASDD